MRGQSMVIDTKKTAFLALLCLLLWGGICGPAAAASPEGQAEITADTIDYDETRGEVRLLGSVRVCYDGAVITSSFARYLTKKQEAHFQGQVKGVYGDSTVTGSQLTAWFAEHRVQMRGKARLVTNRSLGGASAPTVLDSETLVYDWKTRRAAAQGHVAVEQAGRHAYADSAEYDEASHSITMRGNVRFEQGRDEWLMSESIVMDLNSKRIEAQGRVSGRFVIDRGGKATAPADEPSLPEAALIEPAPQTQTVEDVSPLLLPGLQD